MGGWDSLLALITGGLLGGKVGYDKGYSQRQSELMPRIYQLENELQVEREQKLQMSQENTQLRIHLREKDKKILELEAEISLLKKPLLLRSVLKLRPVVKISKVLRHFTSGRLHK